MHGSLATRAPDANMTLLGFITSYYWRRYTRCTLGIFTSRTYQHNNPFMPSHGFMFIQDTCFSASPLFSIAKSLIRRWLKSNHARREFLREILHKNTAIMVIQHSKIYFADTFGNFPMVLSEIHSSPPGKFPYT